MVSLIDPTKPTSALAYTGDVRANFAAAKSEIEALQGFAATPYLPLIGGEVSGPITLAGDASQPLHAVPLQQINTPSAGGPFLPMGGGELTGASSVVNLSTAAPPAPGFMFSARYGTQTALDIFSKVLNVPPRNEYHVLEGVLTVTPSTPSINNYNAAIGGFCSVQTANAVGYGVGSYVVAEANNCQTGGIGSLTVDSPNVSGIYTGVKLQNEFDWYCGNGGTQVRGTLHYGYFLQPPNASINTVAFQTTLNGGANALVTASFNGTAMTVTAVASGTLAVGMRLEATGVDGIANITITAGSGGIGTYTISANVGVIASTTVRASSTFPWSMTARSPDGMAYVALDIGERNETHSLTVGDPSQPVWWRYTDTTAATQRIMRQWVQPMTIGGVLFMQNFGAYGGSAASYGVGNNADTGSSFMGRNHAATAFIDMLHLDVGDRTVLGAGSANTLMATNQGNVIQLLNDGAAVTNSIVVKGPTATLPARIYMPGALGNIQFNNNPLAATTNGGFTSPWPTTNAPPTGTPTAVSTAAAYAIYNYTSHTLNIYDPSANGWYHVTLTAGAA